VNVCQEKLGIPGSPFLRSHHRAADASQEVSAIQGSALIYLTIHQRDKIICLSFHLKIRPYHNIHWLVTRARKPRFAQSNLSLSYINSCAQRKMVLMC